MTGRAGVALLCAIGLTAGCAAPVTTGVTVLGERNLDDSVLRVDGPSRVVFRSGRTEAARRFELRDGVATWWPDLRGPLPGRPVGEAATGRRVVPVAELSSLQVRQAAGSAGAGVLGGLVLGAALGSMISGPARPGGLVDEWAQAAGMVYGGLAGALAGGIIASGRTKWTDHYVFEAADPEPERSADPSGPPESRAPPDGPGPP